ncbi:hypothetical protein MMC07_003825 [Pseudocyphellaria aurata]|nr:hypothetical protein [Pseudocyphellaria aurata]
MPERGGRNRSEDSFHYWNNVAPTKPDAQALATRLDLDFPSSYYGFKAGLEYPVRRLIITGEDTQANYALLLGPLWENEGDIIKRTRIAVLLSPPPLGSPNHTTAIFLDEGSPYRNPRPSTADEQAEMAKYREMEQTMARLMQGQEGW